MKNNERQVLVIGGPTGVGESTITKAIIKKYPIFKRLVTATTRQPRLNEKDGVDYYFLTPDRFRKELKKGNIIEYTYVKNRHVYYGSLKQEVDKILRAGRKLIINSDLVGAKYYKKNYNALTLFIMPESLDDLKKRLIKRDPKISKIELNKRLAAAKNEIENEAAFYDYKIVNKQGELDKAIQRVVRIIKDVF